MEARVRFPMHRRICLRRKTKPDQHGLVFGGICDLRWKWAGTPWGGGLSNTPGGPAPCPAEEGHVRFGSKADMCSAKGHVRFTPFPHALACHWLLLYAVPTSPCSSSGAGSRFVSERHSIVRRLRREILQSTWKRQLPFPKRLTGCLGQVTKADPDVASWRTGKIFPSEVLLAFLRKVSVNPVRIEGLRINPHNLSGLRINREPGLLADG